MATLSANERQWIKDCFMMVDKAKTGQIDNKQLRFAITALGIDASAAAIEKVEKTVAQKGDGGMCSLELWIDMMSPLLRATKLVKGNDNTAKAAAKMFQNFDIDGDGYVTADEFRHSMKAMGMKISDEEVTRMFEEMNIDAKDGKLGPQDFQALIGPLS